MPRLHVCLLVLGLAASGCEAFAQDADAPPALPPAPPAPPSVAALAPSAPTPAIMQAPLEKSRAAIEECRERRLRKELSSYKQSAQCSNPRIFAAWQEASYPHMDLIAAWLDAREAASEKVDQHVLTPEQFEREMGELTNRLTAEERRRRAGLVNAADSGLALQVPASAQVIGVATPPGQEKSAAKKSAAARARAAEPSTGSSSGVGSLSSVSSLDARTPKGVGGPLVPVNPNSPAARAAMARASAPGEGSSGLYALIASQRSEAEARLAFRALQGRYPNLLGGRDAVIRRADLGAQGTFYRVEVGPLNSAQADELCGGLKAAGAQCMPRYE